MSRPATLSIAVIVAVLSTTFGQEPSTKPREDGATPEWTLLRAALGQQPVEVGALVERERQVAVVDQRALVDRSEIVGALTSG